MPVQFVSGGYRWGKKGKIYRGKNAKKKARKQGIAILISQKKVQVKGTNNHRGYVRRTLD